MDKLSKIVEKRSMDRFVITKLIKKAQALGFEVGTLESLVDVFEAKPKILKDLNLEIEDFITDPTKFKLEVA